jgi:hypothetical protein
MSCPPDTNTGFVTLIGPIQTSDLNAISVSKNPLIFLFGPKSTPPTLINGNMIDESTGNSISYNGNKFLLGNIQICKSIHDTYRLPGQTQLPVAELILSFHASSLPKYLSEISGILLCVPIYNSGNSSHSEYLDQLIDPTSISCNYTNESGAEYEGTSYKTINNSSLIKCVKSCCDDTNCLAYTFKSGVCSLKNTIPTLNKNRESSIISGKINRNTPLKPQCESTKKGDNLSSTAIVPNLESIFYESNNDTSQTSFAYKTCFETLNTNNELQSNGLYVFVFPNGIHLTQQNFENLRLRINNTLKEYEVPPAIRGPDPTLYTYKMDGGNKKIISTSNNGNIYKTSISTCTTEFKDRFEYFTSPPFSQSSSSSLSQSIRANSSHLGNSPNLSRALDQCNYYKTNQYKCVPFDQLRDLSGEYVIPGNVTMDDIMKKQNQTEQNQNQTVIPSVSMDVGDMEEIIGYVFAGSIAAFIILFGVSKLFKR